MLTFGGSAIGGIPEDLGTHPTNDWGERMGWFMNNVLSLQLARERVGPRRGGSNEYVFKKLVLPMWNSATAGLDERSTSNQRLLERLEAENAQLRRSVVELVLQLQALRDGAGTLSAYDAGYAQRSAATKVCIVKLEPAADG